MNTSSYRTHCFVFWGRLNTLLVVMTIVPNSHALKGGEYGEKENSATGVNEVELGTRGCQRDNPRLSVN